MPVPLEIEGERFGSLTVLKRSHSTRTNGVFWLCECDCGATKALPGCRLREHDGPRHCGAAHHRKPRPRKTRDAERDAIQHIWRSIIRRCEKITDPAYPDYGGRGIKMCRRWRRSFATFAADVGARPSPKLTLDRKNVNGNYSPRNVRWATRIEQARNKRNNLIVLFRGRPMTLAEAVEITGVSYGSAYRRIHEGWPIEEALTPGRGPRSRHVGPPTATVAALGRACQEAGITLDDIKRIAAARARRSAA